MWDGNGSAQYRKPRGPESKKRADVAIGNCLRGTP